MIRPEAAQDGGVAMIADICTPDEGCRYPRWCLRQGPVLVGAAVAGPQLDEGTVGGFGAGDVHAAAGDREGAVAVDGPVLRGRVAVAVPHLHLGAGGTAAVVVVHALGAVVAGHDGPGRPGAAGRRRIANRDDVGLGAVVGGIGRVAGGHDAFEERPGGAVAVVAADPEDDGAFDVHGHVTARGRQGTAVPGGQPARIRVAALDRIGRGAVVLDQGGHERAVVSVVVGVVAVAAAE